MRRGKSYYGGKGYYIVRFPPGEKLLYSQFSGGKGYYGGKATIQHRYVPAQLTKDKFILHHIDTLTKIIGKIDKCELPTFYWLD